MIQHWNRIIHFFKNRKQFFHILLVTYSMLLFVMIIFYVYAANETTDNIIHQYYTSQEDYLRQNIEFAHSDLSSVFSLSNNTLYNSIVIQSVMNPPVMDYGHKLNLVNVLSDTAEHNRLITYISYYVSSTGLVYESNKSVTPLENCAQSTVWAKYLAENNAYRSYTDQYQTDFLYDENGIYLIQGFQRNLDNSIAYLMVTLNPSIFTSNIDTKTVSIYNHHKELLYGSGEVSFEEMEVSPQMDSCYHLEQDSSHMTLYYQDSLTGWIFLYQITPPAGSSLFTASQNLLLFSTAILFVGLIISIFVSSYMYHPIHELVQNAEKQLGAPFSLSDSKNEFDYLKSTYTKIMNHQTEMVALFPVIYNSVVEKLFDDLFFDHQMPSAELIGRLDMLSEKFKYYQRYLVILAVPSQPQEDFNNQIQQLSQTISSLSDISGKLSVFPKNDLGVILVLGFSAKHSAVKIHEATNRLCQSIQTSPDCGNIQIGVGGIYTNIMDVRASLDDAKINLTFRQYTSSFPGLPKDDPLLTHADRNEIIREIRQIYDQLEFCEEEELLESTHKVLYDIQKAPLELSHKKITCGFFMNLLYSKYAAFHLTPALQSDDFFAQLFRLADEAEITDFVFPYASDMIHSIWQYYHAPNYKYVQQSLEYIAGHFSEPDLSLETVSDSIGITPTYLSRIFKNILGQNFLYYVNNYRINHAKNLLQNSELSIQEIGTLVGYTNMTTFFRVFKKYTDTTPKAFRQMYKK
ncbi:helix-turn-helix domain-containing protein [Hominifimenecus sp. rT4P-3]|uniref:helix-turn-helix domain-containing protein n=1 Tax=Hominifimenecus sp. rT4P-3 TaxID=3242979 RepID=UPI003DA47B2F